MPLSIKEVGKWNSLHILWRRRIYTVVNFPVKGNIFRILASDESWWLIIPTHGNGLKKKESLKF